MVTLVNVKKILAIFIALLTILACGFLNRNLDQYPKTIDDSKDLKFYAIDPKTFLDDLQQGNDALTPIVATPDSYPLPLATNKSYMWTYQEYLNISDVLAKSAWTDGLDNWKLRSMYFNVDCQDPLYGFTIGDFRYFQEVDRDGKSLYSVREILVRPLYAEIEIGSGSTYPKTDFDWASIDLSGVVVDTDKALQIAEKNGGKNFRLSVNNHCQVFLSFNPNSEYDGWKVLYDAGGTNTFEIHVDAYDDGYRIIK